MGGVRSHWAWGTEDQLPGRDELRATGELPASAAGGDSRGPGSRTCSIAAGSARSPVPPKPSTLASSSPVARSSSRPGSWSSVPHAQWLRTPPITSPRPAHDRGVEQHREGQPHAEHLDVDEGQRSEDGEDSHHDDGGAGHCGGGGPAGSRRPGSHDSLRGRYQHRSPSRDMAAGSRIPRTTVASISTAAARPMPSVLVSTIGSVARMENTATMMTAALVTTPALLEMPPTRASRV